MIGRLSWVPVAASVLQLSRLVDMRTLKAELQLLAARSRQEGRGPLEVCVAADIQELGELVSALFQWVASVCSFYGASLRDFAASFADGSTLCLLVRYNPRLMMHILSTFANYASSCWT